MVCGTQDCAHLTKYHQIILVSTVQEDLSSVPKKSLFVQTEPYGLIVRRAQILDQLISILLYLITDLFGKTMRKMSFFMSRIPEQFLKFLKIVQSKGRIIVCSVKICIPQLCEEWWYVDADMRLGIVRKKNWHGSAYLTTPSDWSNVKCSVWNSEEASAVVSTFLLWRV